MKICRLQQGHLQKLSNQIEKLRSEMHYVAALYGISHGNVLEVSRSLDVKINQYMRLKKRQRPDRLIEEESMVDAI